MTKHNPKVDWYFDKTEQWREEVAALRAIALGSSLSEELKWGKPCYLFEGSNIVLIHDFKDYCALLFFKGVLMKDPKGILMQQTKNVQAARQIRFANLAEITKLKPVIKTYLAEAINVEQSDAKIPMKETAQFEMPPELQDKLDQSTDLEAAFAALTPGRQRAYLLYFGGAKQSATRTSRVERYVPQILAGKGLDD